MTEYVSPPDYGANTLSVDDLKPRLAYLEERHQFGEPEVDASDLVWDEWDELEALRDVANDLDYCWGENATLVSVGHWVEYCREVAYDLGEVRKDSLVDRFVDWERYAAAMQQDYRSVTLPDGCDYYVRP